MFVAVVIFSSIVLLWQLPPSTTLSSCRIAYSQPGRVLSRHAVLVFEAASSSQCTQKCGALSACHSINWYSDRGLCELNNATHLSSPENFVPARSQGAYLIYFLHPLALCSNRLCKNSKSCLMNSDGINYRCQVCTDALGMEDGRITNSQITASSMYDLYHGPSRARLNNRYLSPYRGAWSSEILKVGEYLQVDLRQVVHISKVATQGRPSYGNQFVTKYSLQYSLDGTHWSWVQQEQNVKEFPGNSDRNTVVTNTLPSVIRARYIRIVALSWNEHISMRAELYGCDL